MNLTLGCMAHSDCMEFKSSLPDCPPAASLNHDFFESSFECLTCCFGTPYCNGVGLDIVTLPTTEQTNGTVLTRNITTFHHEVPKQTRIILNFLPFWFDDGIVFTYKKLFRPRSIPLCTRFRSFWYSCSSNETELYPDGTPRERLCLRYMVCQK